MGMSEVDLDYYQRRAEEEVGFAQQATNAAAVAAHYALAELYLARVSKLRGEARGTAEEAE